MINPALTFEEKEQIMQTIAKIYCSRHLGEMVAEESNDSNDFSWAVIDALNSLDRKEKRLLIQSFFQTDSLNRCKSDAWNRQNDEKKRRAIDHFLEKLELT